MRNKRQKSARRRSLCSMIMICTLFLLPACLLFPLGVYAESQEAALWENPDTGYRIVLEDDAQLLDRKEQEELAAAMRTVTAYGNAAFKSISANSYSAASFADDYYHGLFGTESGTLFLIDMDNRELYLFSDGAIYRTIGKSYADTITDNVYRYASNGDYYLCASSAFEQIGAVLAGEKIAQPMKYISNALLAFILAALLNYFLARSLSRSSKPGTGEILGSISTRFDFRNPRKILTSQTKVYDPPSSSSSGGSGGGHSGHSSGGGGGHRF